VWQAGYLWQSAVTDRQCSVRQVDVLRSDVRSTPNVVLFLYVRLHIYRYLSEYISSGS
jgi:hypothetical protein